MLAAAFLICFYCLFLKHFYFDWDFALQRSKFDRIGDEVNQYLLQPCFITINICQQANIWMFINFNLKFNLFLIRLKLHNFKSFMHCLSEIIVLLVQTELVIFNFGKINQIVDEIFKHKTWIVLLFAYFLEEIEIIWKYFKHTICITFLHLYLFFHIWNIIKYFYFFIN